MTLREKIAKEALSWVDTPFFPHAKQKGVGVDCVQLACAVYRNAAKLPDGYNLPSEYSLTSGDHLDRSVVIQWLSTCPYFVPVADSPEIGDLVAFRMGKVAHHVGIMVSEREFVHAVRGYGVIHGDMRDGTWSKRLRGAWRFSDERQVMNT